MTRRAMFKIGAVIRYGEGPTALMEVTHISQGHGSGIARYYGTQFYGGSTGAYHEDCRAANLKDLQRWANR